MKKPTIPILALAAVFIFSTVAFAAGPDGTVLFKQKCVACHGADASGATPAGKSLKIRDLRTPDVQKQTDDQLFDFIANGGPSKKPTHIFKTKGLSDADVKALVTYIRSIKK
jgi:mono/diheme cytochrome c family protein